jgi:hypothetical protein
MIREQELEVEGGEELKMLALPLATDAIGILAILLALAQDDADCLTASLLEDVLLGLLLLSKLPLLLLKFPGSMALPAVVLVT